ncbi:hypothetical protein LTR36_010650 [Oleoguttula mirabilis]|uniref:Uncharacterized protein n=1 Tax=Oleoguttula mirabilis TaxID=1507867 RepID=A0AAV9JR54_9PEZI|nr:hypothetical protein LTR36_010650 [Oleoguttula mirabilis]
MLRRWRSLPSSFAAPSQLLRPCARLPRLPPKWDEGTRRLLSSRSSHRQEVTPAEAYTNDGPVPPARIQQELTARTKSLPTVCPGCGAHSQTVDSETPGFYGVRRARNAVKKESQKQEDAIFRAALANAPLAATGEDTPASQENAPRPSTTPSVPICDRCHELLYQSRGTSIVHPSMQSIQAIIEESPHKHNHIYHVLDAADFPMSLIPNLQHALHLPQMRTRNRRSKSIRYVRGRVAEVSFIVTRSDLLAPNKEQVDKLMPYLQEVLRDALGRHDRNIRLGNVRCVSAIRGWWTKNVKEEIWATGGAGWMVGKVNVGKSALFEAVYPKGRGQREGLSLGRTAFGLQKDGVPQPTAFADSSGELSEGAESADGATKEPTTYQESELQLDRAAQEDAADEEPFDEDEDASLLPPAQPETAYPVMPLVSSLPGTTASPIRIPFGDGKGELIDLPGVHRSNLDSHVKAEHKKEMVMKSRVVPEQYIIRPGQSLLLGGLIRITHKSTSADDPVILAYPFLPPAFTPHVTGTHKAIAIQTGTHSAESHGREGEIYTGTVETIATDTAKTKIKPAGTYSLEWDVTKRRAGPLTDPTAGKQKAANLPFMVYSADVLIESVGWVELVCQVRRRIESLLSPGALGALDIEDTDARGMLPEVDVFSPEGKYVGLRRPMCAWLLGGKKKTPVHERRLRPRQTISVSKRREGSRRVES